MEGGGGTWLKACSWNLEYLNTTKTIQTSRNSENFITETLCAILEGPHGSSDRWWHFLRLAPAQPKHPLEAEPGSDPPGSAVSSEPWALDSCHPLSPAALLHPSTFIWFSLHSCSHRLGVHRTGHPRSGAWSLHSAVLLLPSSQKALVSGRGEEQENGNTYQMYKCKVSTQII